MNPIINYYESGKILSEEYYLNGKLHRIDGPAAIYYYESGKIQSEQYLLNGQHHRTDGPAFILYYESGKIKEEYYYYFNGIQYETLEELKQAVKLSCLK